MELHQPGRRQPRIGWIVAGLALVPLVGVVSFAVREIREVTQDRTETREVVEAAEELVSFAHLGAAVDDEKYWTYVLDALTTLQIEPSSLIPLVGIDVEAEYREARADVEYWLAAVGPNRIADQIAAIRADDTHDLDDRITAFEPVEEQLESSLQTQIDELLRSAALLPDSDQLVDAARVLEAAAAARSDMAWQLGGFFGSQFEVSRSGEEYIRMLVERAANYRSNMEQLQRLVSPDSRTHLVLAEVTSDPDVELFAAETRLQVERALRGEVRGSTLDIGAELEDPVDLASIFTTAVNATDAHLPLVNAAADDITDEAHAILDQADRRLAYAVAFWVVVTLLSLVAALAATRMLVRPLRRMSSAAAALRNGSLEVTVDESGPREIQTAARAINEAIDQLKLVERQAMTLAEGDIDDPVLAEETPGRLGASLRGAVTRLTDSLAEQEEFRRQLAHEAAHDALTGLANRRASIAHLTQALARARRSDTTIAVLFVDLDGFKAINDLHGHPVGDRVLKEIAKRLAVTIREGDLAGRMGGDEFIVVAEPVADQNDAMMLAERLTAALSAPLTASGVTVNPRCSIGVALPHSDHSTADELIHDADLAVYEAKRRGRNEAVVCSDDLRNQVARRGMIERGLAAAIEHDQLELHFQTIVNTKTREPIALEALLRWRDHEGRLIPPDEFIPVAERTDLILDVDLWVLDRAARQLATWQRTGRQGDLVLAVNLSSRHVTRSDLAQRVLDALLAHGADPRRLVVEVTESALLDDFDSAGAQLSRLREQGVKVAIDDFGTGFTSLTHLRSLPVDILKIDRSYTRNLSSSNGADLNLIRLIIDVGHLLGLEVTAEGVETEDEATILTTLGADTLQGFYFSRPVPVQDLPE